MAGSRATGLKTAKTVKLRYGPNYYQRIGAAGGKKSRGGGFSKYPGLAKTAGSRGGVVSSRGRNKPSLAVRRRRATLKNKDPFSGLFDYHEEFNEGFHKSRWYDRIVERLRGKI